MSALLDLMPNFALFVLSFPTGVVPEGVEPSSEFCQYEEYEIQGSKAPPQVGDIKTFDFDSSIWIIAEVHHYQSENGTGFYTAICTQDGQIPHRSNWAGKSPILYFPALKTGELARNEDGSAEWGIVPESKHIPSRFGSWRRVDIQWFEPTQGVPNQGFRAIALCWCNASVEVVV